MTTDTSRAALSTEPCQSSTVHSLSVPPTTAKCAIPPPATPVPFGPAAAGVCTHGLCGSAAETAVHHDGKEGEGHLATTPLPPLSLLNLQHFHPS